VYVSDDAVLGNYAPADEYLIFHVEAETIGRDWRPIHLAFLEPDRAARRKFFGFLAETCAMIMLITGGVYVVQRHYSASPMLYATDAGVGATPTTSQSEALIPSRIRVLGPGTRTMKNLMAGSLDDAIGALDIRGVRVSAGGSRALIGTQVIKSGDSVWAGWQKLIFKGVTGEKMVFEDASGRFHLRNLKAVSKITMKF
jgi:hypothetical protein